MHFFDRILYGGAENAMSNLFSIGRATYLIMKNNKKINSCSRPGNKNKSIKLSEYREGGVSLEYPSEYLSQMVKIKHYAFYIPVAYSPKGYDELSVIDSRHVNMSCFDDDSNVTVKKSESVE
ncbi:MAG: hypothetical protein ACRCTP_07950 [Aeromonas popoffii]|uniref:hypothetical protein n=1 Tax=Aeromonas popoffii TaxID=70856 RepID=UPI003F2AD46B